MELSTAQLLGHIPMFAGLAPQVLAPLQAACRSLRLERGDILFKRGERGHEMYIIESGRMRIWIEAPDGRELELAELGEHEVLGELEMIDGKSRSASAQALEATHLIALPRDALFTQMGNYPGMAVHLMTVLSERLRKNNERHFIERSTFAPESRLAGLLLLLAEEVSYAPIALPDSHTLAPVLGLPAEEVEAALARLIEAGSVESNPNHTLRIPSDLLERLR